MFISFKNMRGTSRIWIYQASKKFSPEEEKLLTHRIKKFTHSWKAHNEPLTASYTISHSQFIIVAVDESFNKVSGCGIDESIRYINQTVDELNIKFMNHAFIAFQHDTRIDFVPFNEIKTKIASGDIKKSSIFFDNSIQRLTDFHNKWTKVCQQSWMAKYF